MTDLTLRSDDSVNITLTGCTLAEGLSFNEWADILARTVRVRGACHWILGDQLLYGEARYGEKYAQAISITGLRAQTLRNCVSVCRRIPYHRRRSELSFSHHAEIAYLTDEEQDSLLDLAIREDLPAEALRDLRKELAEQEDAQIDATPAETTPKPAKKILTKDEYEADASAQPEPDAEPEPEPTTPAVGDVTGTAIPITVKPAWEYRSQLVGWVKQLGAIKKAMLDLEDHPVGTYLNSGEWQAAMTNAQRLIQATTPHVICPYCKGVGCHECAECGWMSKYQYDHTVPANAKA